MQALHVPPSAMFEEDGNVLVSRTVLPGASNLVWSKDTVPQDTVGKRQGKQGRERRGQNTQDMPCAKGRLLLSRC